MFEMCFSTAPSVTTSVRAIAALVRPSAISWSTSVLAWRERLERPVPLAARGGRSRADDPDTRRSPRLRPQHHRRGGGRPVGSARRGDWPLLVAGPLAGVAGGLLTADERARSERQRVHGPSPAPRPNVARVPGGPGRLLGVMGC